MHTHTQNRTISVWASRYKDNFCLQIPNTVSFHPCISQLTANLESIPTLVMGFGNKIITTFQQGLDFINPDLHFRRPPQETFLSLTAEKAGDLAQWFLPLGQFWGRRCLRLPHNVYMSHYKHSFLHNPLL